MYTAMVSGHTDISPDNFQLHYHASLDSAAKRGDKFIMGDAVGADTMARLYLTSPSKLKLYPDIRSRITIYPSRTEKAQRLQEEGFQVIWPDKGPVGSQPSRAAPDSSSSAASGSGRGRGAPSQHQQQVSSSAKSLYTAVVVEKKGRDARRFHHVQRDARMTATSDYDILYVRNDREARELYGPKYRPRVSGTEMNRMRRAEIQAAAKQREKEQHEDEKRKGEQQNEEQPGEGSTTT